ncbi:MAG: putative toxin-antitoxin system toxin component, PIN family [Acidobacteria bacterium]|nr:MAG: putative toxin-antitoxin system toxin component, PIN family [Acidobacteriota bacterium]
MKVVLDTNVIVSALVFGGIPRRILEMADAGVFLICYSRSLRAETEGVLREKFGWPAESLARFADAVWSAGAECSPTVGLHVVAEDPDDDRILECAMAAHADVIVSGDRHLLRLGSFRSIPIASPRLFLTSWLPGGN